jgi:hypothetical protein
MQNFSGDARLLMITPEIKATEDTIITGLGIIPEIIRGGASWSGSNVSLRVVENTFINHRTDIQSLLNFIVKNVANYMGIPAIKIKMADFKMADDLDKKRLMVQLAEQVGSDAMVSKPSVMRELGLDPEKEYKEIQDDLKKRLELKVQEAEGLAEAQGAGTIINALYAADAQIEQNKRMQSNQAEANQKQDMENQQASEANTQGVMQDVSTLAAGRGKDPSMISVPNLIMLLTQRFMRLGSYDVNEFKLRMLAMKNSTPALYSEVYKNLKQAHVIALDTIPELQMADKVMGGDNSQQGVIPQYSQGADTAETPASPSAAGSDPNMANATEMTGLPPARPPRSTSGNI